MRTARANEDNDQARRRESLREAVRERRKRLGISQVELSFRARVHLSTISLLERGAGASDETIAKVAAALGLRPEELAS
jgi:transcriptional regulator with XRE-family HTH domain